MPFLEFQKRKDYSFRTWSQFEIKFGLNRILLLRIIMRPSQPERHFPYQMIYTFFSYMAKILWYVNNEVLFMYVKRKNRNHMYVIEFLFWIGWNMNSLIFISSIFSALLESTSKVITYIVSFQRDSLDWPSTWKTVTRFKDLTS